MFFSTFIPLIFAEDVLRYVLCCTFPYFIAIVLFRKSPVKNLIKINIDILDNFKEKNICKTKKSIKYMCMYIAYKKRLLEH